MGLNCLNGNVSETGPCLMKTILLTKNFLICLTIQNFEEEFIPLGCVKPASMATGGGMSAGGGGLPGGMSAQVDVC